jgi:hypothetical protein
MQDRLNLHHFWQLSNFAVLAIFASMLGCEPKISSASNDDDKVVQQLPRF